MPQLTIRMVRRMKNAYSRAIQLAANNQADVHSLATQSYSLAHAIQAFVTAERHEGVKLMIKP